MNFELDSSQNKRKLQVSVTRCILRTGHKNTKKIIIFSEKLKNLFNINCILLHFSLQGFQKFRPRFAWAKLLNF